MPYLKPIESPDLKIDGLPTEAIPKTRDYSAIDNLFASITYDTWMGEAWLTAKAHSEIVDEMGPWVDDPNYDPITDPENQGYEQQVIGSKSAGESAYMRRMIDYNNSGKQELDYSGAGVSRFMSQFADPMTYVPIPFGKGLGFVNGFKKSLAPAAGAIGVSEGARYYLDPTMTEEELAISIGTGTLISSTLVGGISHFTRGTFKRAPSAKGVADNVEQMNGQAGIEPAENTIQSFARDLFPNIQEKVQIKVQKIDEEFLGTVGKTPRADGSIPMAFHIRKEDGTAGTIYVDDARIRETFDAKPWLSPKPLKDGTKATPLNRDFATPDDWARFVVAHEKAHVQVGAKRADETLGQYEDRVNAETLIEFDRLTKLQTKAPVPEKLVKTKEDTDAALIANKDETAAVELEIGKFDEEIAPLQAKIDADPTNNKGGRITKLNKKIDQLKQQKSFLEAELDNLKLKREGLEFDAVNAQRAIDEFENLPDAEALGFMATGTKLENVNWSQLPFYVMKNTKLRELAPQLAGRWMALAHKIAGTPGLMHTGAREGVAVDSSVEMLAKQWHYRYRTAIDKTEKLYLQYKKGSTDPTRGQVLAEKVKEAGQEIKSVFKSGATEGKQIPSLKEFRRSVSRALMDDDRPTNIPEVDEAVREWRAFFDEFEKAGKETGVFQSARRVQQNIDNIKSRMEQIYNKKGYEAEYEDLLLKLDDAEESLVYAKMADTKTTKYFHRIWRLDQIEKNPEIFLDKLRKHFRSNPHVSKGGKTEGPEFELALEARVQETYATIRKEAIFQDTLGMLNKGDRASRVEARIAKLEEDIATGANMEKIAEGIDPVKVKQEQIRLLKKELGKKGEGVGGPTPTLTRKLDINERDFLEFLEQDVDIVAQHYTMRMAPAIEMSRKFGDFRIDSYVKELSQELDAFAKANPNKSEAIMAEKERLIQATHDLRDKVLGVYGIPDDPSALTPRALRFLKAWNVLTLMGKAWMAALADAGRIAMSEGFTRTFGGMVQSAMQRVEKGRGSEFFKAGREVEMAGEAMDIVMATRFHSMTDMEGGMYGLTKMERGMYSMQGPFFLMNLLSVWTDNAKRFAGAMIQSRMIEDSIELAAGKLPEDRVTRLAAIGIDKEMATRFVNQWKQAGEAKGDNLFLANTEEWSDQGAVRSFRAFLAQEVNTAVITPHAADKLNFMSKPMGSVLMQYRGFGLSATQRIMGAALQQRDKQALAGIASMIGLAAIVDNWRRPDYVDLDIGEVIFRAVETSGVTGIFSDVNSALEIASGQQYGLRPMFGFDPVIKDPTWAQRTGAPLGAVGSQWLQFTYALTDPAADGNDVARGIRYMLPYQNLWFWSDLWGRAQRSAAEVIEE